jgi:hypothetical protein
MDRPKIARSLVRIIGIFESHRPLGKLVDDFERDGYQKETMKPFEKDFHKNTWYPEFRDIWFLGNGPSRSTMLYKSDLGHKLRFTNKIGDAVEVWATCDAVRFELFLMPKGLHFFAVELDAKTDSLQELSDLLDRARNFSATLEGGPAGTFSAWIEQQVLMGIKICSDDKNPAVNVDEYSGSKFKLYTVIDLKDRIDEETRLNLLYDMGCVVPLHSAGGNTAFTPNGNYFQELMANRISVFKNFDMLPLFDSFTVVGDDVLTNEGKLNDGKWKTYSVSYFRIVMHCLFLKYYLFRYNTRVQMDAGQLRNEFEDFLNHYRFSHISYNFLPNLIYQKTVRALELDEELEKFEKRIQKLSETIKERQQKRTNALLGVLSVLASANSAQPVLGFLEKTRNSYGWSIGPYYTAVTALVLVLAGAVLFYLFPHALGSVKDRLRRRGEG